MYNFWNILVLQNDIPPQSLYWPYPYKRFATTFRTIWKTNQNYQNPSLLKIAGSGREYELQCHRWNTNDADDFSLNIESSSSCCRYSTKTPWWFFRRTANGKYSEIWFIVSIAKPKPSFYLCRKLKKILLKFIRIYFLFNRLHVESYIIKVSFVSDFRQI